MSVIARIPPPRTPSPRVKIHRSQSFDSPSSRVTVTPIDESPYSKSASFIGTYSHPLPPQYNVLKGAQQLNKKISDDDMSSDASYSSSEGSVVSEFPTAENRFALFGSAASPSSSSSSSKDAAVRTSASHPYPRTFVHAPSPSPCAQSLPQSSGTVFSDYQDHSSPMYDPWLVRIVLDLFDVRGFDWMMIAEPIERVWGFRTSSAEVLEILIGNGRVVGRRWWE